MCTKNFKKICFIQIGGNSTTRFSPETEIDKQTKLAKNDRLYNLKF